MNNSQTIALIFSALAHPLRVDIFKCLLAHYPESMTVGSLSRATDIAPSSLSHHLRLMEEGNLISRSIDGRKTKLFLEISSLRETIQTLMQVCCSVDNEDISQKVNLNS